MSHSFKFRKDNIVGMVITLGCYSCRGCQKLSVVFVLASHWTFLLIKAHASHIFGRNCQFSFRIDLCWIAPLLWRRNAVGVVDFFVVTSHCHVITTFISDQCYTIQINAQRTHMFPWLHVHEGKYMLLWVTTTNNCSISIGYFLCNINKLLHL